MIVFQRYEVGSWLARRNPTAKLVAHLALTLALTLVFDPLTPLLFACLAFMVGPALGRVPVGLMARALLPFWLLAASLALSNALFASRSEALTVVWTWGPFRATLEGAMIGLSLGERSVAVALFSILLIATTDPTDLVRSLVQQARMPARIAYPLLAALRFLPILREEQEQIRLAQRLRGLGRRQGAAGWVQEQWRLTLPLLALAIRRSERVALAMDARGFSMERAARRTHARTLRVGTTDVALVVGTLALAAGLIGLSAALGTLRLWNGQLGA